MLRLNCFLHLQPVWERPKWIHNALQDQSSCISQHIASQQLEQDMLQSFYQTSFLFRPIDVLETIPSDLKLHPKETLDAYKIFPEILQESEIRDESEETVKEDVVVQVKEIKQTLLVDSTIVKDPLICVQSNSVCKRIGDAEDIRPQDQMSPFTVQSLDESFEKNTMKINTKLTLKVPTKVLPEFFEECMKDETKEAEDSLSENNSVKLSVEEDHNPLNTIRLSQSKIQYDEMAPLVKTLASLSLTRIDPVERLDSCFLESKLLMRARSLEGLRKYTFTKENITSSVTNNELINPKPSPVKLNTDAPSSDCITPSISTSLLSVRQKGIRQEPQPKFEEKFSLTTKANDSA
ncbi:hypothetical protein BDF14DRAFT_1762575 [Spinellus fusiger]|nr:hypothetical protein BDF14DRAFT_1762575 [Spinellus fusiger]